MTIKELIRVLNQFQGDLEVVTDRHSDLCLLASNTIGLVNGVANEEWVMVSHPTMSDANKAAEKVYLYIGC